MIITVKQLSVIQIISVIVCAISVFDLGFSLTVANGILFNSLLFHNPVIPDLFQSSAFWGEIQFWSYCFIIVAGCQLAKLYPPRTWNYQKIALKAGITSIGVVFSFTILAIILSIQDYRIFDETLSSLTGHGFIATLLMSWGMMIGGLLSIPFFLCLIKNFRPIALSGVSAVVGASSGIFLFLTGISLPHDQPFNHGPMAIAFFLGMALTIGLYSCVILINFPNVRILAFGGFTIFTCIIILAFIPLESFLPIIQKAIALSYICWWYFFGKTILNTGNTTGN